MIFKIWNTDVEFIESTKQLKVWDKLISPSIRTYSDMENMYIQKENLNKEEGLYFMYRWVYLNEDDRKLFEDNKSRYDITILIPELVWDEYNKTFGHYHPANEKWNRYQEIYQVLSWHAIYLQQNNNEANFTNAFSWDKVVMKEWFWHVTINPSDEDILVMSNIVDETFDSEYGEFKENKGATHYYTTSWFIKNTNYKNNLEIIEKQELFDGWDMYEQFLDNPEKFNFLH